MTTFLEHDEEYTGRFNPQVWAKLLAYTRPYRRHLNTLLALAVVVAGAEMLFMLMTKWVINHVEGVTAGQWALNLWPYAIGYAAMMLTFCLSVMLFIRAGGRLSTGMSHDIRQAAFTQLQELSFSFYDRRPAGWLLTRLTSDSDRLSRTLAWGTLDVVWGMCMVIGIAVVLLAHDWVLALVVLAVLPVLAWVSLVFQKRILAASRNVRKQNSTVTAAYSEGISGVRTTKTLVREAENLDEFGELTGQMYRLSVRSAVLSATYFPLVISVAGVGAALALWVGGNKAMAGALDTGTLVLFITCAGMLIWPIFEMSRVFADLQSTQAAAERVLGLIDTEPDVKDSPEALAAMAKFGGEEEPAGAAVDGLDHRIETVRFDKVSFAYNEGETVLTDFDLTVRAGQTVALVGPTGGGKSTIVSLMCRFYEPTVGRILINEVDYRRRSLKWLQSNLGIVLQQPHVFSGTVRENIRYGRLEASDEAVETAAKLVRAHEFITTLENGYDTEVGEAGGKLSTGQKQLLSFARAVLADPQIFVMDEATSSVDTETERAIQHGLEAVLEGRISFIIAHRLSTIRSADVILVIEDGRVIEQGNHEQLIDRRGHYYELYTNQFAEERTSEVLSSKDP